MGSTRVASVTGSQTNKRRSRSAGLLSRAIIESLETRKLLSFTVNTLLDNNTGTAGSLRWAIAQAAAAGGDHTITFDPTLTASGPATINLNGNPLELDDTTGTLTIEGPTGANGVTIDSEGGSAVFHVDSGSTAEIDNLTITGGKGANSFPGFPGVVNDGNLTISGSSITNNDGGIVNDDVLNVTSSLISGNTGGEFGGGIYNEGSLLTISSSVLSDNYAWNSGGAIGDSVSNFDSNINISNCLLTNNSTGRGPGGAIGNLNNPARIV
jgi:hypothetical protein